MGIRAKARPTGRLGLDGQGLQAPNKRKEVSAVQGWPKIAQGMEAAWPRLVFSGLVHDSPATPAVRLPSICGLIHRHTD